MLAAVPEGAFDDGEGPGERRVLGPRGHPGHVVVHKDEAAAGPDQRGKAADGANRVGHVEKQEPGEDQVEGRTRHRVAPHQVAGDEGEVRPFLAMQLGEHVGPEGCVDVEAGDVPAGADHAADEPHCLARAAAGVEAAHSLGQPGIGEHRPSRRLPRLRLQAQPLILGLGPRQDVAVGTRHWHHSRSHPSRIRGDGGVGRAVTRPPAWPSRHYFGGPQRRKCGKPRLRAETLSSGLSWSEIRRLWHAKHLKSRGYLRRAGIGRNCDDCVVVLRSHGRARLPEFPVSGPITGKIARIHGPKSGCGTRIYAPFQ